ncbi:sulfur Metabolism [Methylobacterium phyllosphaerae]|uniref:Sulfur Metabolism n=1 Tax=Methylobacterium phyllosphaerae TaxID=418223 RepID=A0AAE8HTW3_9HYPH|nr:NAD(P)-binding protein [Methylobacterium phyllosphaerae]APT34575.1 sulfur Metabolism [Methylobacterium phyllosphaerae]SFH18913.1 Thioredoxin reductase [Methylobacterium phyllosphaerae]
MTDTLSTLPIAVIGAGPVGLAAAAHCLERGLPVKVYEAGQSVAANVRDWGHVRLFSPWEFNIDPAARRILLASGWSEPPREGYPTGHDLVEAYLAPLAATPPMADVVETGVRVDAIARHGIDKVVSKGREARSFVLAVTDPLGRARRDRARAVIDTSGTWTSPNPAGSNGLPVPGEAELADRIVYRIPDVLGRDRSVYAGKTTLVVGAGHSAANVLLDLARLAEDAEGTVILWATRGSDLTRLYGGGANDKLAARGALGSNLRGLVESGRVRLTKGFAVTGVRADGAGLSVEGETCCGPRVLGPVDTLVAATGQRPDLALTRDLRLDLDPWLESARALAPLIDPNVHSCGTVYPHGHRELAHPEPGFYTAGIKSYGRAPTFLMMTGYEQVRSIVAALDGDLAAADAVQLSLPETGVCSTSRSGESCCGEPDPDSEATPCCGQAA